MYKHILVPTDGSPLSLKAAREAASLAKGFKAKITALHVTASYSPPMSAESVYVGNMGVLQEIYRKSSAAGAKKALDKVGAIAAAAKVACAKVHVTSDSPWAAIIKEAKARKCDLIVMASHGRKGLAGVLLGSETMKVLTHSKTPVLVCR